MAVGFNAESLVRPSYSQPFSLNKPRIESKPGENGALLFVYVCLCLCVCQYISSGNGFKKENKTGNNK